MLSRRQTSWPSRVGSASDWRKRYRERERVSALPPRPPSSPSLLAPGLGVGWRPLEPESTMHAVRGWCICGSLTPQHTSTHPLSPAETMIGNSLQKAAKLNLGTLGELDELSLELAEAEKAVKQQPVPTPPSSHIHLLATQCQACHLCGSTHKYHGRLREIGSR